MQSKITNINNTKTNTADSKLKTLDNKKKYTLESRLKDIFKSSFKDVNGVFPSYMYIEWNRIPKLDPTSLRSTPYFCFPILTWTHQIIHSIAASSCGTPGICISSCQVISHSLMFVIVMKYTS